MTHETVGFGFLASQMGRIVMAHFSGLWKGSNEAGPLEQEPLNRHWLSVSLKGRDDKA